MEQEKKKRERKTLAHRVDELDAKIGHAMKNVEKWKDERSALIAEAQEQAAKMAAEAARLAGGAS